MPARILVTSGITAGSKHWLERPVLRLGSEGCDICIPSVALAAHAATIEYRGGRYFVYNKTRASQRLNLQPLEPQKSAPWLPGQPLELAADVVLVLEIEGDPGPAPRPAATEVETYDAEAPAAAGAAEPVAKSTGPSSKSIVQLGVTAACIAGCAFLLVMNNRQEKTTAKKAPEFAVVVQDNLESSPQQVQLLQYARALQVRERPKEAREWFLRLRDELTRDSRPLEPSQQQMLAYVLAQLEKLD
jgi:hypothetical protein